MAKCSVEVQRGGVWRLVKDFSSEERALMYGGQGLMDGDVWRAVNRETGVVVGGGVSIGPWRPLDDVVARQQRERMHEIASRHRASQRDEDRRRRLRGFQFVGASPLAALLEDRQSERPSGVDRVNWKRDGF